MTDARAGESAGADIADTARHDHDIGEKLSGKSAAVKREIPDACDGDGVNGLRDITDPLKAGPADDTDLVFGDKTVSEDAVLPYQILEHLIIIADRPVDLKAVQLFREPPGEILSVISSHTGTTVTEGVLKAVLGVPDLLRGDGHRKHEN